MNAGTTVTSPVLTAQAGSPDIGVIDISPPADPVQEAPEVASVEVATPEGPVEVVFSIRDGILDDLSRVSDSIATMQFLPPMYYAKALAAGLGAAYIGVKLFRFAGIRGPIGATFGAVMGGVLLDSIGKRMIINRVERSTNGVAVP